MKFLQQREVAIVSYAETPLMRRGEKSALELAADVLQELLQPLGLQPKDANGLALTMAQSELGDPFWSNLVAETLGITPSWMQVADMGGASFIANIARASAAIHAEMCDVVVCMAADAPTRQFLMRPAGYRQEFADSVGYSGPPMVFGLLSSAYDDKYKLPLDALAKLAIAQRDGALLNPLACEAFKKPLTADDYLNSRMIADPIRMLDCVMRCDGGNGVVLMSTQKAQSLGIETRVYPTAYREISNFDAQQTIEDITVSGFTQVGPQALADVEMKASDIHMLHAYDDFLIAVLLQLEQIGFCKAGESGAFIQQIDISYKGMLPINTGGGQISAGQPGLANGGVNCVEAVRQLMGQAGARQVKRPRNAMVTGIGSMQYARNWGTSAVMILEGDQHG